MRTGTQAPAGGDRPRVADNAPMRPFPNPVLPVRIKHASGQLADHELSPGRHRSLHLGLIAEPYAELVEIAAGPRIDGGLRINTRRDPGHYLPGGAALQPDWHKALCNLAVRHHHAGEEVFLGPAQRRGPGGAAGVISTHWLWVDIDDAPQISALEDFSLDCPPQLLVESGGSGGMHAYWRLADPTDPAAASGLCRRLAAHVGGDRQCANPDRVLRLAGSINHKTGAYARLRWVDLHHAGYQADQIAAVLPPEPAPASAPIPARGLGARGADPYKAIHPFEYVSTLTGRAVSSAGFVSCPHRDHEDRHPSCKVSEEGFYCHSCGAGGAIYDCASAVLGGPTGKALRGEDFKAAVALVRERFGERA